MRCIVRGDESYDTRVREDDTRVREDDTRVREDDVVKVFLVPCYYVCVWFVNGIFTSLQ